MNTQKKRSKELPATKSGRLFSTGFGMGLADLVPGVSGGTVALLLGIYDELLLSIKLVTGDVPKYALKGQFKKAWQTIPFRFLVPVFSGILIAIVGLVRVMTYLLDNHPVYVWSLFFGLVLGSALVVSRKVKAWDALKISLLVFGLVATYLLVGISGGSAEVSSGSFVVTGLIASSAMVLPGISGSLIMVILGQYENVLNALSSGDVELIAAFALGAIVGLALFARLLSWLLKNYHDAVIAFLVGMLLGSLRKVWPWQEAISEKAYQNIAPVVDSTLALSIILAIIGFGLVWKLEKLGITKDHDDI